MKIDAHNHFWKYNTAEYGWIDETMQVIRRDFLSPDLEKEMRTVGIDGVVSVQARQTLKETRWLLSMAAQHEFIKGVVVWVPLTERSVREELERFGVEPKLRAVRHVLQAEADGYMLRDDFNAGIAALRQIGIAYDFLVFERQLVEACRLVDHHANQIFVLDHIGKPRIKENQLDPWRQHITELARRENVYCKLSGMVTEADFDTWTEVQLQPYFETVLEAFGPRRLMFGSDWPVCLVACSYARWYEIVQRFAAKLSDDERANLFGATAYRAYGLL
ncbi:MAG: amidohydrolase family protein [Verrucomicrobia bacterium]|nr:amidohydrolase family protein [Verrucomicrobiota bacterium]